MTNARAPFTMQMSESNVPICRFCGSTENKIVSRTVLDAPDAAIYRCASCDMVYLFPIMTEAEEAAFYAAEFEKYMEGRAGAGWRSPAQHFRSYQEEGERRLALVRPALRPDDSVLEIGSSTGYFLDDLRGYVRAVAGVEPSDTYGAFSRQRGIETVKDISDLRGRTFDVIVLYYVLEHLRDPVGYLRALRAYCAPGARLLIEVPNVDDALLTVYHVAAFDRFYWQKAHYHNFSRQTLAAVLQTAGYRGEVSGVQRYDLSNHMTWMMEGKPGGHGRFRDLFGSAVEAAYAEALKRRWVCDTLFASAEMASPSVD